MDHSSEHSRDSPSLNCRAMSLDSMNDAFEPIPVDFGDAAEACIPQWNEEQLRAHMAWQRETEAQPPRLARSRVTFDATAATRETHGVCGATVLARVRSCGDMTKEERNAVWFQRSEVRAFKRYAKRQVAARLKGQPWTNRWDDTLRGLEVYFPDRELAHRHNLKRILQICRESKGDPELIAAQARQCSTESVNLALLAGVQDYYEATNNNTISVAKAIESATFAQRSAAAKGRVLPARTPSATERRD